MFERTLKQQTMKVDTLWHQFLVIYKSIGIYFVSYKMFNILFKLGINESLYYVTGRYPIAIIFL